LRSWLCPHRTHRPFSARHHPCLMQRSDVLQSLFDPAMHLPPRSVQRPVVRHCADPAQSSSVLILQTPCAAVHKPFCVQTVEPLQSPSWATHLP